MQVLYLLPVEANYVSMSPPLQRHDDDSALENRLSGYSTWSLHQVSCPAHQSSIWELYRWAVKHSVMLCDDMCSYDIQPWIEVNCQQLPRIHASYVLFLVQYHHQCRYDCLETRPIDPSVREWYHLYGPITSLTSSSATPSASVSCTIRAALNLTLLSSTATAWRMCFAVPWTGGSLCALFGISMIDIEFTVSNRPRKWTWTPGTWPPLLLWL